MKSWVYEPGYPVVTLTRNSASVVLTQERFFLDPAYSDDTKWYIPITYITETSSSKNSIWLMPDKPLVLSISDLKINNTWILFNNDQKGMYIIFIVYLLYYIFYILYIHIYLFYCIYKLSLLFLSRRCDWQRVDRFYSRKLNARQK